MQIFRHSKVVPLARQGSVVTIGNFDGVHRGHQAVIAAARHHAQRLELPLIAITFEPHPKAVLRPEFAPARLTGCAEKCRQLLACGVDGVYVLHFTRAYARTTPEDFARHTLHQVLQTRQVVIGHDFGFGRDRSAGLQTLQGLGAELGYGVESVAAVTAGNGQVYSSTAVREALAAGHVQTAAGLLGRPYELCLTPQAGVRQQGLKLLKNGEYLVEIPYNAERLQAYVTLIDGRLTALKTGPGLALPACRAPMYFIK